MHVVMLLVDYEVFHLYRQFGERNQQKCKRKTTTLGSRSRNLLLGTLRAAYDRIDRQLQIGRWPVEGRTLTGYLSSTHGSSNSEFPVLASLVQTSLRCSPD